MTLSPDEQAAHRVALQIVFEVAPGGAHRAGKISALDEQLARSLISLHGKLEAAEREQKKCSTDGQKAVDSARKERDRLRAELTEARETIQRLADAAKQAIADTPGASGLGPYEDSTGQFNALKAWHGLWAWMTEHIAASEKAREIQNRKACEEDAQKQRDLMEARNKLEVYRKAIEDAPCSDGYSYEKFYTTEVLSHLKQPHDPSRWKHKYREEVISHIAAPSQKPESSHTTIESNQEEEKR